MTDFRINVIVDPRNANRGVREVERGLVRVERRAVNTGKLIRDLFGFVGLGIAIRQLFEFADAFTEVENKLRILVGSEMELISVTDELLDISNRTRTGFTATATLYQRLGLATRNLAIENVNLGGIVESVNQALILSGASAKEANNGLIQLSQGIASNRLGGDELRSTLEQLPVVADVIAQELGVTRGELRELGAEGAITGEVIIRAFQNASEQLENDFGKTVPTLAQSFEVLRNNVIALIGEFNRGSGVVQVLGTAFRFVGENLENLVRSLAVAAVGFTALRLAPTIQGFFQLQAAIKAGNVVLLGSAEAARQKAIFDRDQAAAAITVAEGEVVAATAIEARAVAERAAAAGTLASIQADSAKLAIQAQGAAANLAAAQAAAAQAAAERANISLSGAVADVRARVALAEVDVTTTRRALTVATEQATVANRALATSSVAVRTAEASLGVVEADLAATRAGTVAATNGVAAAQNNLAAAQRNATIQSNFLLRSLDSTRAGLLRFLAAAASPVGLIVGLAAGTAALIAFRNQIRLAGDTTATLGDLLTTFRNQASSAFTAAADLLRNQFGPAIVFVQELFGGLTLSFRDVLLGVASAVDGVLSIVTALVNSVITLFVQLPRALGENLVDALNLVPRFIETIFDALTAGFNTVRRTLSTVSSFLFRFFNEIDAALTQLAVGNAQAAANIAAEAASSLGAGIVGSVRDIPKVLGEEFEAAAQTDLIPRIENTFAGATADLGRNVAAAFQEGLTVTDVSDFVVGLLAGAEELALSRDLTAALQAEAEARKAAATAATEQSTEVDKVIQSLQDEQTILLTSIQLGEQEAQVKSKILEVNRQLADAQLPPLTPEQESDIANLVKFNDELVQLQRIIQETVPEQQVIADQIQLVEEAFLAGIISIEQYNLALQDLSLQAAAAGTTISDGIVTGLAEVDTQLFDLASTTEDTIVGAFDSISGAVANSFGASFEFLSTLIQDGKADFKDFTDVIRGFFADAIDSILQDLFKLLAQQALIGLVKSLGGDGGGLSGLFGIGAAANGTGAAISGQPILVGEEGPELFTPGSTGSITPNQQTVDTLSNAMGGSGTTVVQAPAPQVNVSPVISLDPKEVVNQGLDDSQIVQAVGRNSRSVKGLLQ